MSSEKPYTFHMIPLKVLNDAGITHKNDNCLSENMQFTFSTVNCEKYVVEFIESEDFGCHVREIIKSHDTLKITARISSLTILFGLIRYHHTESMARISWSFTEDEMHMNVNDHIELHYGHEARECIKLFLASSNKYTRVITVLRELIGKVLVLRTRNMYGTIDYFKSLSDTKYIVPYKIINEVDNTIVCVINRLSVFEKILDTIGYWEYCYNFEDAYYLKKMRYNYNEYNDEDTYEDPTFNHILLIAIGTLEQIKELDLDKHELRSPCVMREIDDTHKYFKKKYANEKQYEVIIDPADSDGADQLIFRDPIKYWMPFNELVIEGNDINALLSSGYSAYLS
jgi:hypothetical protein